MAEMPKSRGLGRRKIPIPGGDGTAPTEEEADWMTLMTSESPKVVDMRGRVEKILQVYTHSGGEGILDPRDIPTIMYALGLFPKQSDFDSIVSTVEEPESKGLVKTERLVPFLTHVLLECERYQPPSQELMQKAFRANDRDRNGMIDPVKLRDWLMKEGDPLTKIEADNLLKFAVDEVTHKIDYEDYIQKVLQTRGSLASTYAILNKGKN